MTMDTKSCSNLRRIKLVLVTLLLVIANTVDSKENDKENEIPKHIKVIEAIVGKSFIEDVYSNGTFSTGNKLWDGFLNQCTENPTVSCLQKNVYSYLDDSLNINGDVSVGSVCFKKNNVDVNKYSKEANIIYLTGNKESEARDSEEENEIDGDEESESPLEEVTDALYDKGISFLTTHDMKVTLPETFFNGASLRISPRALTKTGALVHIDLEPKESQGEGRIFLKKIKKHIRKKLIMAAIGIVLVIKLIALKLVFVLPLVLGVTTAKKMFIKLLLFIFPPLTYIFKMCSWYYQSYHNTKHHHHHHLVHHHHNKHHHPPYHAPHSSVVIHPPTEHHEHEHYPTFEHYPQDWELSGPGLGNEYVASGVSDVHRNALSNFKPHVNDVKEINAWGLGFPPGQSHNVGEYSTLNLGPNSIQHPSSKLNHGLAPIARPIGPPNPYRNKKINSLNINNNMPKDPLQAEKEALIRAAALAARVPPSPVRDEILRVSAVKLSEAQRIKTETDLVKQQQQIIAANDPETIAAEKFYGVLVDKVDKILMSIGATEAGCKERAVCALYRDPFRHAPYSNLVSNELSKDSNELIPAADSKKALRYYIYVQAAREGQENKDCIALYPNCNIDYNNKSNKN